MQATAGPPIVLPLGHFYGTVRQARTSGGFDISSLAATGREEDVAVHTHADAHFVLVLSGVYISAARWAPAVIPSGKLFTTLGTTGLSAWSSID